MRNVLIVDDEAVARDVLTSVVEDGGWTPRTASTGEEALEMIRHEEPDLVLLDLMLPALPGIEVLRQIHRRFPEIVVVIVTAFSSIEGAVEAMREGAFDYVSKPFKNDQILGSLRQGFDHRRGKKRSCARNCCLP